MSELILKDSMSENSDANHMEVRNDDELRLIRLFRRMSEDVKKEFLSAVTSERYALQHQV
jgi:hypothetical protein